MSDAAVTADEHDETSVPGLWETARWLMRWMIAVCGGPCALVAEVYLSRKERRQIVFWLRPVEAIIRRLLVAEAAKIANTPGQSKKPGPGKGKRPAPGAPFCRVGLPDPEDPSGWTVRFSMVERSARKPDAAGRHVPRLHVLEVGNDAAVLAPAALALAAKQHRLERLAGAGPAFPEAPGMRPKTSRAAGNPWRLARRIEAALRVLANPRPYAGRLARRLAHDAARLARTCRPPPPRPPGARPPYADEPLRRASDHALRALDKFDTG